MTSSDVARNACVQCIKFALSALESFDYGKAYKSQIHMVADHIKTIECIIEDHHDSTVSADQGTD